MFYPSFQFYICFYHMGCLKSTANASINLNSSILVLIVILKKVLTTPYIAIFFIIYLVYT